MVATTMMAMAFVAVTPTVVRADGGGGWKLPVLISNPNLVSADPFDIAYDTQGTALVVWQQWTSLGDRLWYNRYDPGSGWQIPDPIPDAVPWNGPSINIRVVSPVQDWFFIFYTQAGHVYSIWYNDDFGWASFTQMENVGGGSYSACSIDVATDHNGKILLSWVESDGAAGLANAYAKVFDIADWSGWGTTTPDVMSESGYVDVLPGVSVAMGNNGFGTASWDEKPGAGGLYQIEAKRLESGVWSAAQPLNALTGGDARYSDVAMDSSNNAVCVWQQDVGGVVSVFAAKYVNGSGPTWLPGDMIENSNQDAAYASIAMNPSGDAIAVWKQPQGPGLTWGVYGNVYNKGASGNGFDKASAVLLGSVDSGDGFWGNVYGSCHPSVDIDNWGNAVVVWTQISNWMRFNAFGSQYTKGVGWDWYGILESYNNGNVRTSKVAMDPTHDKAIAVWEYGGFTNSLELMAANLERPPSLTLWTPDEGYTTEIPVIYVSGITDGAAVSVNGIMAFVYPGGGFWLNIPVSGGTNPIWVAAYSSTGMSTTIYRMVTFNNPIPGIESDIVTMQASLVAMIDQVQLNLSDNVTVLMTSIASLQDQISTLSGNLDAMGAKLSTVWDMANNTQSDLSTAWNQLNSTASSLTTLQGRVNALRTQLIATHAGLNSTDDQVSAMLVQVDMLQADLTTSWALVNTTRDSLAAARADLQGVQEDLAAAQDNLTAAQSDINDRSTTSSTMMWAIIAIIVAVIISVLASFFLMRRKGEGGK